MSEMQIAQIIILGLEVLIGVGTVAIWHRVGQMEGQVRAQNGRIARLEATHDAVPSDRR